MSAKFSVNGQENQKYKPHTSNLCTLFPFVSASPMKLTSAAWMDEAREKGSAPFFFALAFAFPLLSGSRLDSSLKAFSWVGQFGEVR